MTQEQARDLAARIRLQFMFHRITVLESADKRNAPQNWFIAVEPPGESPARPLLIHSRFEWDEALLALAILKDNDGEVKL